MYCLVLTTHKKKNLSFKLDDLPVSTRKYKKLFGIEIHHEVFNDPHAETL